MAVNTINPNGGNQNMADLKLYNVPGTGPLIRADMGSGTRAAADFINFQKNNSEVFSVDSAGLPDPAANQATRQLTVNVGDLAADSNALQNYLFTARAGITITAASVVIDTATADGSVNGQIITLKRSNGDLTVATYTTAVANPGLAQATVTTMGAITNGALVAGGYLYVTFAKVSAGLAMSGLTFIINYTMST